MVSLRKIKVVALLSIVATLASLGFGRGQDAARPALPTINVTPLAPAIPRLPTPEEQREQKLTGYIAVHTELAKHLDNIQLGTETAKAQALLTGLKEKATKDAREKAAKDELAKAKTLLADVATKYKGTEAGTKAQRALNEANGMIGPAGPAGLSSPLVPK